LLITSIIAKKHTDAGRDAEMRKSDVTDDDDDEVDECLAFVNRVH